MWKFIKDHAFIVLCWFVTAFAGLFVAYFANAVINVVRARDWPPTDCNILTSRVIHERKGRSRIHVEYEYAVNGVAYRSTRYKFLGGNTNTRKQVPLEYLAGKIATCYVDPSDPTSAVLVRGMTWDMLFGLIPLLLLLLFGLVTLISIFDVARAVFRWFVPATVQP
jgi:hypothetical protein